MNSCDIIILFRFLPSRGPNEEYSTYLLLKGKATVNTTEDHDEQDTEDDEKDENHNPVESTDAEYHSTLLSVACSGDVPRGVLTFKNTTPANNHQG